ncbi:hypothetical protein SISSUDRAFT_1046149 [Sistotremastrum suecicum HHB10207 ss-3]|uniref:DUF6535 domain-containing protein n=1 Tax=Sistotremastrum suecicum HHB10207 ss-3 TaxID=1314776 RepID=A0A166E0D8_9AGAM|nr:hypothetical protein SISSUDRAFT_1046149 [Sistotremastrum suecicum HHB10207 ss-3]
MSFASPDSDVVPSLASPPACTVTNDLFDTPTFNKLINVTEKQSKTLEEHSSLLEALKKEAMKDEQPYDERDPDDEQTWSAMYKIAAEQIRPKVEEWKSFMDVSLVFIALFLAVLTAFLIPITQSLTPSPSTTSVTIINSTNIVISTQDSVNDDSSPSPPPDSVQKICAFYFLSLIVGIFNAVLCVLGRQWTGKLNSGTEGKTNLERTLLHEERRAMAERWLEPLVIALYSSLLLSIALFVSGLLYQIWTLADSFSGPAPTLLATCYLASFLAFTILVVIATTTGHAVIHRGSPFHGPFSQIICRIIGRRFTGRNHLVSSTLNRPVRKRWAELSLSMRQKILNLYMDLVSKASDSELLERAVPSFVYQHWVDAETLLPLKEAYARLMGSDTSSRVKRTVRVQIFRFLLWIATDNVQQHAEIITWCRKLCFEIISRQKLDTFREFFPVYRYFMSFEESNQDLRRSSHADPLQLESCIFDTLCTYDQDGELGDRHELFIVAVRYCDWLQQDNRQDDITRLLAVMNLPSLVRSLLRDPGYLLKPAFERMMSMFLSGKEAQVLCDLADFLSTFPIQIIEPSRLNIFLRYLIPRLGPDYVVPTNLDLSRILETMIRSPVEEDLDVVMFYLEHGGYQQASNTRIMLEYLSRCTWEPLNPSFASATSYIQTHYIHACLVPLPAYSRVLKTLPQIVDDPLDIYSEIEDNYFEAKQEFNDMMEIFHPNMDGWSTLIANYVDELKEQPPSRWHRFRTYLSGFFHRTQSDLDLEVQSQDSIPQDMWADIYNVPEPFHWSL